MLTEKAKKNLAMPKTILPSFPCKYTDLIKSNDMRMTEQLHDLNLAEDLLEIVDVQLCLVNYLDRHLHAANQPTTRL